MFGPALNSFTLTLLAFAFVFGALWGSFLNVCIARIPRGMSVVRPGSHCFACQKPVRPWDNVPIFSYLILRGRCRDCGQNFGGRHALVELITALLSTAVAWHFALSDESLPLGMAIARYLTYFTFVAVMIVLSFIDLDTKRLPDIITLPAIVVFFLSGFTVADEPWLPRLLGLASGYLFVRLVADGYYYLTGREGLGLGDGKLLAVIGALLGWKALPPIVFSASFLGILISVPVLVATRKRAQESPAPPPAQVVDPTNPAVTPDDPPPTLRRTEVPFGPFLAASALLYLFLHDPLWCFVQSFILGY